MDRQEEGMVRVAGLLEGFLGPEAFGGDLLKGDQRVFDVLGDIVVAVLQGGKHPRGIWMGCGQVLAFFGRVC